jgi:hypothetical protein
MPGASKVAAATAAAQLVELLVEVRIKRAAHSAAGSCRPVALALLVAKLVRVEAHEKRLDILQKFIYPGKVDQGLINSLDNQEKKISKIFSRTKRK